MEEMFEVLKDRTDIIIQISINQQKQIEILAEMLVLARQRIDVLESIVATFKQPVLHTDN